MKRCWLTAFDLTAYAFGIGRIVKPGDVVLDLGCGTGILSLLAAL